MLPVPFAVAMFTHIPSLVFVQCATDQQCMNWVQGLMVAWSMARKASGMGSDLPPQVALKLSTAEAAKDPPRRPVPALPQKSQEPPARVIVSVEGVSVRTVCLLSYHSMHPSDTITEIFHRRKRVLRCELTILCQIYFVAEMWFHVIAVCVSLPSACMKGTCAATSRRESDLQLRLSFSRAHTQ